MASFNDKIFPSTMDWMNGFNRTGKFPLDRSSMFDSLADAQAYAKGSGDSRDLGGVSYVGQIITVYENGSVKVYKIEENKSLTELAAAGDSQGKVDEERQARENADKLIARNAGLNENSLEYIKSENELISGATSIHNATELIATKVNANTSNIAMVTTKAEENAQKLTNAQFTKAGGSGSFIQDAVQKDGKVTVTAVPFGDVVTEGSAIAPKSSAVYAAIEAAKAAATTTVVKGTDGGNNLSISDAVVDGHKQYTINLTGVASATGLDTEIKHREDAITNLTATVTGNTAAINNEVSHRRAIIGQGEVDGYKANTGETVTYIKTATSLNDADLKLDAQAKVNADAIAAETNRATKAEGDNKDLINGVRTDLGQTTDDGKSEGQTTTAFGRIKNLETAVGEGGSVAGQIKKAIESLDVTNDTAVDGQYISKFTETDGIVSVERRALVNTGDKVLSINSFNGIQSTIALKKITSGLAANIKEAYQLVGIDGKTPLGEQINIAKDRSLQSAELVSQNESGKTGQFLKLTYNVDAATGEKQEVVYVDMSNLLSEAEFKDGLTVSIAGEVSVKLASDTEKFLSIVSGATAGSGIKLSGVQAAIDTAKAAAKTEITTPGSDTHINVTKASDSGHDVYTITSKDVASATDLTNLSNNTINGHALSTETITLNGSEINVNAGKSVSIAAAIDTLTQKDSSIDERVTNIEGYKVNYRPIMSNPVLDGRDIKLDGYTIATVDADVAAGDTVNVALGKLAKKASDNKQAATDASGKVDTEIGKLKFDQIGGDGSYIKTVKQANGIISATTGTFNADTIKGSDTASHVTVSVAQSEGNVTGVTVTTTDIASNRDLGAAVGRIDTIEGWKINDTALSKGPIVIDGGNLTLTGYSKGSSADAIVPNDTVNVALGKLENQITNKTLGSGNGITVAGQQVSIKLNEAKKGLLNVTSEGLEMSNVFNCGTY